MGRMRLCFSLTVFLTGLVTATPIPMPVRFTTSYVVIDPQVFVQLQYGRGLRPLDTIEVYKRGSVSHLIAWKILINDFLV